MINQSKTYHSVYIFMNFCFDTMNNIWLRNQFLEANQSLYKRICCLHGFNQYLLSITKI